MFAVILNHVRSLRIVSYEYTNLTLKIKFFERAV
jgi:hypothetical protein